MHDAVVEAWVDDELSHRRAVRTGPAPRRRRPLDLSRSTANGCSSRDPTTAPRGWRWPKRLPTTWHATSDSQRTPASTCCASTRTSPDRSCTTRPTKPACCCGRTCRCSGATRAGSASRPCGRRVSRCRCSDTIRRSPSGAATTNRWRSTSIPADRSTPPSVGPALRAQMLPTWNKSILDRSVKRALEQADGTRPVVAHSGVLPHPPQLDGTDSHLYFGWYWGDERDFPKLCARVPRLARFVTEFGAQAVPADATFCEPERWPDLDWEYLGRKHALQKPMFDQHVPPADYAQLRRLARRDAALPGDGREASHRDVAAPEVPADRWLRAVLLRGRDAGGDLGGARARPPAEARLRRARARVPAGDRGRRPAAGVRPPGPSAGARRPCGVRPARATDRLHRHGPPRMDRRRARVAVRRRRRRGRVRPGRNPAGDRPARRGPLDARTRPRRPRPRDERLRNHR